MGRQIKITREELDIAIAKLNSIQGEMKIKNACAVSAYVKIPVSEIKRKVEKLPFYTSEQSSSGECVNEIIHLTGNMYLLTCALENLIVSTKKFLMEAEDKWFDTDEEISRKY